MRAVNPDGAIMCAFTPWTGNQGIPMRQWSMLDEEIKPDWEVPPLFAAAVGTLPLSGGSIRLLVAGLLSMAGIQVFRQVVGDATADVDDLVAEIQQWLNAQRAEQGYVRKQKPRPGQRGAPGPIRDGQAYEDAVLRALDELEKPSEYDDPGYQDIQPIPTGGRRRKESFVIWLERRYSRKSVGRYMRRR